FTISPDLQQLGERRIRHWLNEGQLTAMQLLDEHRELLEKIANMLIERESLYADEIKQLFS
ncbi:MAG: hypothetical protein NWQ54_02420, partial [Paraglaciecola sp.]|nr:hypothetical protein [Paraglaciecola sp.]